MPQRILGIDVGSYSIKVAVIERSFKSFSFVEFFERRIQYNELLSPEESTAIAIQGLMDDYNLSWDIACCGFPAEKVTSRLLTFPFSSAKKIEQTVQFEIESYIPFDVDSVVLDYTAVWQTKDASRIMVVYVQKGELVKELTMLGTVGIDPRYISVEGVELINLVNLGMVPPEGAYAIIDIGHEKSTVTICKGRQLGYIRAISIAGKAITKAISVKMGVPLEEAEKLKIEVGNVMLAEEEADEISKGVSEAVRGVVDELLLHIRQTLFAYRDTEDVPVEGVYICGGSSRLPGIDRYLSDSLKLNVTYLNCTDFHFSHLDRAEAHRHVIPQALSLALKGVAGGGPDINLRSGEFAFKGDVEQFGGNVRKVGIIIGLIIFLALINFTAKYYAVKQEQVKVNEDAVALVKQALPGTPERAMSTPKAAISLLKTKETEIDEQMKQLQAGLGQSPLDILRKISLGVPPRDKLKLEVEKLSITDNRVTMSCIVDNYKSADELKVALESSPNFRNVEIGNLDRGVKDEVKFKLSMETVEE